MTNVPTTVRPAPAVRAAAADATALDAAARGPLLFLLGSGIVWLVVSGVLALISSIQLHSSHFLDNYAWLTYGRTEAMRQTAFVYGWAANVGLAIAIWILGRLGGSALRALNWALFGAVFWNIGVTLSLVGIAAGDLTSFPLFQAPRYIQPFMAVSYAAIAISGIVAWIDRRNEVMYASQWYAVTALFLFPWLFSVAQLVLLWSPLRGVAQAVGAGWYAQSAWSLWLAPLALAAAYYIIPRVSGRTLPHYDVAKLGFWTLILVGGWSGARHLIGGPVPAWLSSTAIVAVTVLLLHYAIVFMNLRAAWGVRGTAAGFVRFGVLAYLLVGVFDAITAFRGVAVETQFTFVTTALEQLALYGSLSMIFFGAIYFMVPRLTGHAWVSTGLTVGHRLTVTLGVTLLVVALAVAGWTQGVDLLDPKTPIGDMLDHIQLPLLTVTAAQFALLGANVLLLVNFFLTISASVVADVSALNPVRANSEASAT